MVNFEDKYLLNLNSETPPEPEKASSTEDEPIHLRFPEVYESLEWQELSELDRAQVLLVAEGYKPGTFVGGDHTNFQKIAQRLGLEFHFNTDPKHLGPVYTVSRSDAHDKYIHDEVQINEQSPQGEGHRIAGKFLGYPACCTEEYIDPKKNRAACDELAREKSKRFVSNVDYEVEQLRKQEKPYNEDLDYAPPTFTPCSATCEHATKILHEWGRVLRAGDADAAQELKYFNMRSWPYSEFHEEEIDAVFKSAQEERKFDDLQRSVKSEFGPRE